MGAGLSHCEALDEEPDTDASGTVLAEYTYWLGAARPHSLRKRERSDSVFYYLVDHPGNVTGLVDANDQVVASYRYGPFGLGAYKGGSLIQPLTYMAARGDVSDAEGGLLLLYYMRNRVYDAWQQRFLSEDPIGLNDGINQYTFAGNNSVNHCDPSGLDHCERVENAPDEDGTGGGHGCSGGHSLHTIPGVTVTVSGGSSWS